MSEDGNSYQDFCKAFREMHIALLKYQDSLVGRIINLEHNHDQVMAHINELSSRIEKLEGEK